MAKSQQTFSKSEKEKKRLKKRQDKQKKMEARKAEREENGSAGIQFAYVDHNGNLTDTPPDPDLKVEIELEDIAVSVPKKEDLPENLPTRIDSMHLRLGNEHLEVVANTGLHLKRCLI